MRDVIYGRSYRRNLVKMFRSKKNQQIVIRKCRNGKGSKIKKIKSRKRALPKRTSFVHTHTYTHIHTLSLSCTQTNKHKYKHTHTHPNIHTHSLTHTRKEINTHTHFSYRYTHTHFSNTHADEEIFCMNQLIHLFSPELCCIFPAIPSWSIKYTKICILFVFTNFTKHSCFWRTFSNKVPLDE